MIVVVASLLALAVMAWPSRGERMYVTADRAGPSASAVAPVPVEALAGTIQLLAMTLRSGCGVVEALEAVGSRHQDAVGAHLLTVASAMRWGVPDREAWGAVPDVWIPVARAFTLARRAGVPPGDLLLRVAEDLREAERARLETATAKLGVRVVIPLGLAFLPAFILTTVVPIVVAITSDVLRF